MRTDTYFIWMRWKRLTSHDSKRSVRFALLVVLGVAIRPASAQLTGAPTTSGPTRPQQVPLSGRTGATAGVTVQQQPVGGDNSVDTISTTVQVGGNYAGSTPAADATGNSGRSLTIAEAIQRGLLFNLGTKFAARSEQQASLNQTETRSELLPNISAQLSENVNKINLATSGFDASAFPAIGQYFPSTVGPFHYYSAQANFSENVLDFTAYANYGVAKRQTEAAKLSMADAREQVVLAVAAAYLRILSTIATVQSEEAQVKDSQAVYDQSVAQEEAGAKAHVDVNRNLVQLQTERQRLAVDRVSVTKARMALARMIGLSIDEDYDVTDALSADVAEVLPLSEAYNRALAGRQDLRAAEVQVRVAEQARRAAGAERLPTVKLQGFYGIQGVNPNSGTSVYNGSAQVNIPIFNGGQIRSDERLADAALEQRKSELADTREQVRFDVRSAWLDRDVAATQVGVAESNRHLAAETLKQSGDRYFAGATTAVEVVQSEQAVGAAERDYISALFSLNIAKINLARAMGEAEKDIPVVLKGAQ